MLGRGPTLRDEVGEWGHGCAWMADVLGRVNSRTNSRLETTDPDGGPEFDVLVHFGVLLSRSLLLVLLVLFLDTNQVLSQYIVL